MECADWLSAYPALCTAENTTTFSHHSLLEYEITAHYTVKGNPGQGANCINFAFFHGLFWEVSAKTAVLCRAALHFFPRRNFPAAVTSLLPRRIECIVKFIGQYRTNRQESLARDFSSGKGAKPQKYFVYFKVSLTHFWRERSVRTRGRICAVLP